MKMFDKFEELKELFDFCLSASFDKILSEKLVIRFLPEKVIIYYFNKITIVLSYENNDDPYIDTTMSKVFMSYDDNDNSSSLDLDCKCKLDNIRIDDDLVIVKNISEEELFSYYITNELKIDNLTPKDINSLMDYVNVISNSQYHQIVVYFEPGFKTTDLLELKNILHEIEN